LTEDGQGNKRFFCPFSILLPREKKSRPTTFPMLEIQKFLRSGKPLENLREDPYNISVSETEGPLVGFKYSQIDSDMSLDICQEARGLILDRRDWSVVSFPFRKFFNLGEKDRAANIDWDSAKLYEKMDGTCVPIYFFGGEWKAHTLGTVFGEGPVGGENEYTGNTEFETFSDLFWKTFEDVYGTKILETLDTSKNYVFELCTPFNRVVKSYDKSRVTLIGVRNRNTLKEEWVENYSDMFDVPNVISNSEFKSLGPEDVQQLMEERISGLDEGFVIVDKDFKRIKVKSERYVFAHRSRSNIVDRKFGFVEQVVLENEDDLVDFFPEYKDAFDRIKKKIRVLAEEMEGVYKEAGGPSIDPNDPEKRKEFALSVQNYKRKECIGLFFQRLDGQFEGFTEGLMDMTYRKLGRVLKNIDIE
jgi:hypothetical protein